MRAERSEQSDGTGLKELSLCHSMLASWYTMRRSSAGMTSPVATSRFDCRANTVPAAGFMLRVISRGPKRRLKAICLSSSRNWPPNTRTECSSKAARISAHTVWGTGRPVSTLPTRAAKAGVSGVTVIVIADPPSPRRHRRRRGAMIARRAGLRDRPEAARGEQEQRVERDHRAAHQHCEARVHESGQGPREEPSERDQVPAQRVDAHHPAAQPVGHVVLEIGADLHE